MGTEYPIVVSWILFSIREVMGLKMVRNEILSTLLPRAIVDQTVLGETFGSESKPVDLDRYMKQVVQLHDSRQRSKSFLIFTGINRPQYGETHYQGFIVDFHSKTIYVADPARTKDGHGIYKPYLAEQQVIPFFSQHQFHWRYIETIHPCQTSTGDVFCQSWTLYLMITFLSQPILSNAPIPIPPHNFVDMESS